MTNDQKVSLWVMLANVVLALCFFGGAAYVVFALDRSANWFWAAFFLFLVSSQSVSKDSD